MGINYTSIGMKAIYYTAVFFALLTTGCNLQQDESLQSAKSKLKLNIHTSGETRSKEAFVEGDELGLFVTQGRIGEPYGGLSSSNNVHVSNTAAGWLFDDIDLSETPATVYAYYPYNPNFKDGQKIEVNSTDQTDWLFGTQKDPNEVINNVNNRVTVEMQHALTRMRFHLRKDGYSKEGKLTNITISDHPMIGYMNVATGNFAYPGYADLALNHDPILGTTFLDPFYQERLNLEQNLTLGTNYSDPVDVLLFPKTKEGNPLELHNQPVVTFLIDGWAYRFRLHKDLKLEPGFSYDYQLTLKEDGLYIENEGWKIPNAEVEFNISTSYYTAITSLEIVTTDQNPYNEVFLQGKKGEYKENKIKLPPGTREMNVEVRVKRYQGSIISPDPTSIKIMYSAIDKDGMSCDIVKTFRFNNGNIKQRLKVGLSENGLFEVTIMGVYDATQQVL